MSQSAVAYGDTISLRYAIRFRDGTEIVSNFEDAEPDTLTLGDGTLAQTLEQWLIGLKPGERHVFLLEPWQAFGISSEEMIQTLNPQDIPPGMQLEPGTLVEFEMPNGQTLAGSILEVGPEGVRVDFNHPLADCPIEFEVEVVAIDKDKQA
jgi:FKBP-type peptidyl-prolyl cis-trans isomerase SlpA